MKISETLRAMAKELERRGFSPHIYGGKYDPQRCTCFLGALETVVPDLSSRHALDNAINNFIGETIFNGNNDWWLTPYLENEGWTTEDAVAACNIAADIAECDGL